MELATPQQARQGAGSGRAGAREFGLIAAACCLLVLASYAWLAHLAAMAKLPAHTTYYDQLASAFLQGHLYLDAKPNPALLALSNPYDLAQRAGIPVPLDVSLYNGKYYLYFGPVPALILMIAKQLYDGVIGDLYLVFMFSVGMFLCQGLIVIKLWKRFFPSISPWLVAAALLFSGLIAPFIYIVGKPKIYEAAIAGGQFFFIAGLCIALDTLGDKPTSTRKFVLIGLLWSAALGSRITLILPIGLAVAVMLFAAQKMNSEAGWFSTTIARACGLVLVLTISLGILSWFNWARFGSPAETGITYQLAGPDLWHHRSQLFSPAYVLQNLYNYGFNSPAWTRGFPYLYSAAGVAKPLFKVPGFSKFYHAGRVTGILYTSPFLLLGLVPAVESILTRRKTRQQAGTSPSFEWILGVLYGCFIVSAIFFISFFWAGERYLVDVLPCLVLLSIIGSWQLLQRFDGRPLARRLALLAILGLMAISIIISNLLVLGTIPLEF